MLFEDANKIDDQSTYLGYDAQELSGTNVTYKISAL